MGGLGVKIQHFPLTLLVVLTILTLPCERDHEHPSFLRFQVWIVQQGIKMQIVSLMEMTLLASGVDLTADFLNKA